MAYGEYYESVGASIEILANGFADPILSLYQVLNIT